MQLKFNIILYGFSVIKFEKIQSMKDTPPTAQIQKASPGVQIKETFKTKDPLPPLQIKEPIQNEDITVISKEVSEYKSDCSSEILKKEKKEKKTNKQNEKKHYSKSFQCDKCDKKYTWYSGLANHKRFVHKTTKEI
jgi:hypothetical protein